MSAKVIIRIIIMIFCVCVFPLVVTAQDTQENDIEFKIKKIEINELPNFQEGTPSRPSVTGIDKNWIEIFVEYETVGNRKIKVSSEEAFTPEVQLNFIVGIEDATKAKGKQWYDSYSFFSGEVVYLNVYDEGTHYASIYIHPNVVKRYGGSSTFKSSKTGFAFVELSVGGKVKASMSTDKELLKNLDWKSAISATSGVLLKKTQTPWSTSWWGTYEMIKE